MHFTDQPVVTNPTRASNKSDPSLMAHESDHRPRPIIITRDTDVKAEDYKDPLVVKPHSPKASEEQGHSIAKVLEWFSRSSDSSDKHDCEDIIQDIEEDIKIEDLDFEDAINLRPKPESNVYVIIPRHRDKDCAMMNERDFAVKTNVQSQDQELISQTKPLSMEAFSAMGLSTHFSHGSPQDTINKPLDLEKTSPKQIVIETDDKIEERRNADKTRIPNSKPTQHELVDHGITDTAKASRTLMSKSNINSEKENLDRNSVRKVIEYKEEPTKVDIIPKYSVLENKSQEEKKSHVKDVSYVYETQSDKHLNKTEVSYIAKDMKTSLNTHDNMNHMGDIMALNTTSTKLLSQKSTSSLDFGLQVDEQSSENVNRNGQSSDEGCTTETVVEMDQKVKTEEKESGQKHSTSGVHLQQQNSVPSANQGWQQQDNKAERIKELRSFWEKERLQPKLHTKSKAANETNLPATSTKLNKRFSKSAYDLRSIGTESEAETANFTVLPLRDRIEKTGEGINRLQFKMLRDFWAESSKQSSKSENKSQSQEVKHAKSPKEATQLELVNAKHSLNQNICQNQSNKGFGNDSGNVMSQMTDRGLQSYLIEETDVIHSDTSITANLNLSPTEPNALRSSHCPQPRNGSHLSPKDKAPPSPTGMLNKESHHQSKRNCKGILNGRGNSLRRATSMFAINMEDQDQDFPLQSEKVSDTHFVKMTESTVLSYPQKTEANLQVKKSPEITNNKQKATERSTSEDSDSQPLARSFVPQDYQHYLGITENRGKYISPQVPEEMGEIVCTPFETGSSVSSCIEQTDTTLDSAELCTMRGSSGLRPSALSSEDATPETLNSAHSFSGSSANCETYFFLVFKT